MNHIRGTNTNLRSTYTLTILAYAREQTYTQQTQTQCNNSIDWNIIIYFFILHIFYFLDRIMIVKSTALIIDISIV